MANKFSRRLFVAAGAAGTAAAAFGQGPALLLRSPVRPMVIASANGNQFKNGGDVTAVEKAYAMIAHGSDVLDGLIAGVNILELDPLEENVGYGGLPNAEGVVQLDASCMHGPKKRGAGVAALEGVRTPSLVARAVMDLTANILLAGAGAQKFARQAGFKIEDDLNTPNSREKWLEWKRRTDPASYPDPNARAEAGERVVREMIAEGRLDRRHVYGTINCNGVGPKGEICGVTTTSGLAFKIPGRVGDSPILGAGLYVDGAVGAAGSTGLGEVNLYNLCSFLIVEGMRRGMHPKDAAIDALRRVRANTIEKRQLNRRGLPNLQLDFYVVNAAGEYAGVSMYPSTFAICTDRGAQTLATESLLEGKPEE